MLTPGLAALRHLSLPPRERQVLDVLINAYPRPLSTRQIVDRVYGDDPSGGPETAENAVRVYMWRLRQKLETFGWTAKKEKGRSGVRLQQTEEQAEARAA